jgi:hypothetical protein
VVRTFTGNARTEDITIRFYVGWAIYMVSQVFVYEICAKLGGKLNGR